MGLRVACAVLFIDCVNSVGTRGGYCVYYVFSGGLCLFCGRVCFAVWAVVRWILVALRGCWVVGLWVV